MTDPHPAPARGRLRRFAVGAAAIALVCAVFGRTDAAWAHNALIGTTPEDGKTVSKAPTTVVLTFNEPALATGTKVIVTGPDGSAGTGAPELVDNTVEQELKPDLPAGTYTVQWRVTSADGHPINGTFTFRVRAADPPDPPASPTASATPTASASPTLAGSPTATVAPTPTAPTPPDLPQPPPPPTDSGSSGWWWLLAVIPVGLAAALGWRFSRR